MSLQNFINQKQAQIEAIETAGQLAWWNLATTGDEKYAKELTDSKIALRKLYSSASDYQFLTATPPAQDPRLERQKTLLLLQYKENQIPAELIAEIARLETEIEELYTTFRPKVKGSPLSNNELKKILVESLDSSEREEAWSASKEIGSQVVEKVKKLINLRNQSAKKAGFSDFYSMRLELQELDQKRLFDILGQLENMTNSSWKVYKTSLDAALAKRYGLSPTELMPWHYQDPFFQEAPRQELDLDSYYQGKDSVAICASLYRTLSLPADDILQHSDLYEREKKNQHAFCTCIDRKQDIRMLCNLRDNEYWMGTLLHELGHAVYDKFIDQELPYLLRTYAHTSTTEASAMLFGRLSKDQAFLHHYVGVEKTTAEKIGQQAKKQTAASLLVFARWTLVMTSFERAMYQQPEINLNQFWWTLVERYQNVRRPPGRDLPDWASKLHLACAPVYYQNYILGEMTASQIQKRLLAGQEPFCTSPLVGNLLKSRLYSLGACFPWEETLFHATGEGLNPSYFSQDIKF